MPKKKPPVEAKASNTLELTTHKGPCSFEQWCAGMSLALAKPNPGGLNEYFTFSGTRGVLYKPNQRRGTPSIVFNCCPFCLTAFPFDNGPIQLKTAKKKV